MRVLHCMASQRFNNDGAYVSAMQGTGGLSILGHSLWASFSDLDGSGELLAVAGLPSIFDEPG